MTVVDSVIVNDAHEADLLLLKLRLEWPVVSEFVINECHYDYRGRHKGGVWEGLIRTDERFAPYRDRITVNSIPENLSGISPDQIGSAIDPPQCDQAERLLRNSPTLYLAGKYDDDARVFTSDVDEVIDFEDDYRRGRLLGLLGRDEPLQIERIRFHFDWNIRAFREAMDVVNPVFSVKHLKSGVASLSDKKWVGTPVPVGDNPLIFEYCCVFRNHQDLYRKFHSSLHTQWDNRLLDLSVECCHWPRTRYQGSPDPRNRWHWFERVALHERNSPKWVRDNLDKIRTNLVPTDYRTNRLKYYGHDGVHPQNLTDL